MARSSPATALLAPGFRFHPTDEELVIYYLKRKVSGKPLRFDAISYIDIYRFEPWDLPSQSRLQTRDLEWYFFSTLDKKHGHGSRTNRATEKGYWKTTGKDRPIRRISGIVGMKKTLVFHIGRAPRGDRTNWVMHEYRLEDADLMNSGIPQDATVLCRIFQKSGPGPKNGEQYGAPLIEEEWNDDEDLLIPKKDFSGDDNTDAFSDGGEWGHTETNNYGENLDMGASPVLGYYGRDALKDSARFLEEFYDQKPLNMCEVANCAEPSNGEIFDGMVANTNLQEEDQDQYFFHTNENCNSTEPSVDDHHVELDDGVIPAEFDYPSDEVNDLDSIYLDALDQKQLPTGDDSFLEMNDLLSHDQADASGFGMLDEILEYFDATNDNLHLLSLGSSEKPKRGESILDTLTCAPEVTDGTLRTSTEYPQASKTPIVEDSMSEKPETPTSGSSGSSAKDPLLKDAFVPGVWSEETWDKSLAKHFGSMFGSIAPHPAYGVECAKGSGKSVGYTSAQSTSVHVNAGVILISELRVADFGLQKGADVLLTYGMDEDFMASKLVDSFTHSSETGMGTPQKTTSVLWQAMFYFGFLWVLILAVSFKISSCVCAK